MSQGEAARHLDDAARQLEPRLPLASLKLQAEAVRLFGRIRPAEVSERAV